jgi:hypothetical protein
MLGARAGCPGPSASFASYCTINETVKQLGPGKVEFLMLTSEAVSIYHTFFGISLHIGCGEVEVNLDPSQCHIGLNKTAA